MCLGIPSQIIAVTDEVNHMATAMVYDARRPVNIALVQAEGIAPGDWVMVHAGFALSKMAAHEALETLALLQEMSDDVAGPDEPAPVSRVYG